MADRSFEEQVRRELEALRFTPGPQVWENVDAELRKEKKHRWLLWFILLTGLSGSAGLYYQFGHPSKEKEIAVAQKQPSAQPVTAITIPEKDPAEKNIDTERKEVQQIQTSPPGVPASEQMPKPVGIVNVRSKQRKTQLPVTTNTYDENTLTAVIPGKQQATPDKAVSNENEITGHKPAHSEKAIVPVVDQSAISQQEESGKNVVSASDQQTNLPVKEQPVIFVKTDSAQSAAQPETVTAVTSMVKQPKKKWELYGSMDMGMSSEIASLRSAGRIFMLDAAANISSGSSFSPGNALGNTVGGGGLAGVLYRTPSRSNGFSFGLYLQALRNTGKKGSLGVSLGYSYYSSTVGVGRKVNPMFANQVDADAYYLSTDSTTYKNRYHFLSVSGDYYLNFRLGSATSLRWRMGAGIGFLLASNALHFDDDRGILYKDRSSLSYIQTNLSTGLELGLGKKQAFFIGPQFTYFLGASSKSGSSNRHLFNGAVRATIAIPKKKK